MRGPWRRRGRPESRILQEPDNVSLAGGMWAESRGKQEGRFSRGLCEPSLETLSFLQQAEELQEWVRVYGVLKGTNLFCYRHPEDADTGEEPLLTIGINKVCCQGLWCGGEELSPYSIVFSAQALGLGKCLLDFLCASLSE